jgi:hypothetical protein
VTGFAEYAGFGTDPGGDAARREAMQRATVTPEEWRALRAELAAGVDPRVLEAEPYPAPVVAGHELSSHTGIHGTEVTCECGRWDGWYNGARSRRRVLDDWAAHAAAELRAAGPIKVKAERADRPRELES